MPPLRTSGPGARRAAAAVACGGILAILAAAPAAHAKGTWVIKGAGFGHGIGMSQYGAYGSAKEGMTHDAILRQYYTGTTLGQTQSRTVRVLLAPYRPSVSFKGASAACGASLNEGATYTAKRKGSKVILRGKGGGRLANCGGLLSATGGDSVVLLGRGTYRGALEVRPAKVPGKLNAINAVELEDYVRGVISKESPSSWPLEALKAQAVAARSYAIASPIRGAGFDQYADTRSQVYGGIGAETARTNQAVAETSLQVVMTGGRVAQTFFFSTSGGHTENNEFSFLGGTPLPYLRGVPDPNEAVAGSPYHVWTRRFTARGIRAELGSLVRGRLKRIVVTKHGVSPRIVKARIVGTGGSTNASGPTLKARLGLPDTWASFISPRQARSSRAARLAREAASGAW
jgi:stage II sporulation protein D